MTGEARPSLRARVVVAAADHGVAAEGVSAFPPEVTGQMLATFASGRGAVSVLAAAVGADLLCVDAGVRGDTTALGAAVRQTGLAPAANLALEPALTPAALETALATGRTLAAQAAADGITVLVGGEMGIANTTPATCLAAWLTGLGPAALTGPGTGLDADGVARKAAVVARALARHAPSHPPGQAALGRSVAPRREPRALAPLDALRCLGGGEIAVLCGLALGAAEHGVGYLCDGVIATAAAATAVAIEPGVRPWLLAGHRSPEPAHTALLTHLGLDPVLDLGMRLGEGSGATAALAILRLAVATHDGMATFAEAGVAGAS